MPTDGSPPLARSDERAEQARDRAVKPIRILFVCMGNICRSPTAEGVMRGLLREQGLEAEIEVDSAGTGDWHTGAPPDSRATAAARSRGITLEGAARVVTPADFYEFDLILAADRRNLRELSALAPGDARARLHLLREFDPAAPGAPDLDVPDPYYGGDDGFEQVIDLIEAACRGLLEQLRADGRR
jgi:protein-tyrosine phosphatase